MLWWGMFFGFSPDIDEFYYFIKNKNLLVSGEEGVRQNHRQYYSHAPILWLIAGLLVYLFARSVFVRELGMLLWLGSWSHFLLDSIEYGIMWLWPFSSTIYALKNREVKFVITERRFLQHSIEFLKLYSKRLSFYLEVLIIISAIYIYFK